MRPVISDAGTALIEFCIVLPFSLLSIAGGLLTCTLYIAKLTIEQETYKAAVCALTIGTSRCAQKAEERLTKILHRPGTIHVAASTGRARAQGHLLFAGWDLRTTKDVFYSWGKR